MKAYGSLDVLSALCQATGKWGMFVSMSWPDGDDPIGEILKAAPFLVGDAMSQLVFDCVGWLLFDDRESCYRAFDQCVGDDGPTKLNPYAGPARVYACTCSPDGQIETENT